MSQRPNFVTKQAVQFHVLSEEQCAEISNTTFRILEYTGCEVHNSVARELLKKAGCYVKDTRVKIPASLMQWAVQNVPSAINMYDRLGNPAMTLEPYHVYFGPTNSDTFVYDYEKNEKRRATQKDAINYGLLCDALPNVNWSSTLVMIDDLNDKLADIYELRTILPLTTKPIMNFSFSLDNLKAMIDMCELIAGGSDELAASPFIMCMICPIDPLKHTEGGLDQVMYMAQKRLPVLYVPGMSLGCSSPITFAGSIALGMADSFVGMLVGQLTRRGAPFIACNYTDNVNMRTVTTNYSHPEYQLVHAASADVYRYLGIPFSANVGATSCGMFNHQAVFEITTSLYTAMLSGVNLAFSLGALEGGKSSSMEALIFCDECAGFLKRVIDGIEINEYTLAEDVIHEVGPGGMFLAEESTLTESKKFWESSTLVGMTYDEIIEEGAPDMNMRLNQRAKEIIAEGPKNPLSKDMIKQLDQIVNEAERRVKSVQ